MILGDIEKRRAQARKRWRKRHRDNPAALRVIQRRTYQKIRVAVIAYLGGKCSWPGCNWSDTRALRVDHVNGGGVRETRKLGYHRMYHRILSGTPGYQLLCANHNAIKQHENGEWKRAA